MSICTDVRIYLRGGLACQPFTTPDTPLVVGILRARQEPEHQPAEDDGQGKNQRCLCE